MLRPATSTPVVRRFQLSSVMRYSRSPSLPPRRSPFVFAIRCCSAPRAEGADAAHGGRLTLGIGTPITITPLRSYKMGAADHGFLLMSFAACTITIAFTGLVIAAVPTLAAIRRTATSLAKFADTASEEIPCTMAAIRLSGMELSDLTIELSDLSQVIADGVSKSAQAVQAAEAGIRQIGALARNQTISLIEERANLSELSVRPVVAGAARKTSYAVAQARRNLLSFISGGKSNSDGDAKLSDHLGG